MRRLWMVFALAVIALTFAPAPACARCSCAAVTEQQALDNADTVFEGIMQAEDRGSSQVRIQFTITSVTKGRIQSGSMVEITTESDGASCGWPHEASHLYRVYVHEGTTSLCSGNQDLGPVDTLTLKAGSPAGKPGMLWRWLPGVGVVAAIVAITFFVLSRQRRQDSA